MLLLLLVFVRGLGEMVVRIVRWITGVAMVTVRIASNIVIIIFTTVQVLILLLVVAGKETFGVKDTVICCFLWWLGSTLLGAGSFIFRSKK